ncbi:acyl-[acyl-carrier-protein] thioesterase [Prevotella sp. A2931]|uniref:Acyl-[acyl-carrier-protein] thioesterase n=1 Tax=Prevotella illustrans TaxID=2800387 RepID=A0ABS3M578_9BACT|nr:MULTISPECIES: acyl-ACP thioesterase domain-containing protein [Prevotella]MBO1363332.1 acyl-[acyl-carrier-protein] thioesterase [Prevotella illustrans]PTL25804.1 acyl-[acyl-carrier-protein] thioesterase [Prevotella sp. oral taxon 820]
MKLGKIGEYEFVAEPFHCDFSHQLMLGHLGNSMLNAADYHSNDRGYGMEYLNTVHRTWVLSRLAIEMERMPKAYDKFKIATWVESAMKYFTSRNFAVMSADGRPLGYGRSIWAMIDTDTRQPVDILAVRDGLISEYIETDQPCPICKSSRVKIDDDVELVRSVSTYYSDVDVNGHVNSVKYIEHVLDLFDIDFYKTHRLKRMDVAYVAESHQGDLLNFYVQQMGDTHIIRITKSSCSKTEEVEVVRVSMDFIKE